MKLIPFIRESLLLGILLLSGCAEFKHMLPQEKDAAPRHGVDIHAIKDAVPRRDAITRAGNKNPYTVLGKTYHLLPESKGYYQGGVASWYGTKFHGRPTANGEIYSLYEMTAAHKTLPIPSYVRVTNIENQRSVIVRVNDRGPFHDYRLIDLSYAAAVKLGYAKKGTAKVIVEVVEPETYGQATSVVEQSEHYFLQVAAFKLVGSANQLRAQLMLDMDEPVKVVASEPEGFYRVHLGPLDSIEEVQQVTNRLQELNYQSPRLITETAP